MKSLVLGCLALVGWVCACSTPVLTASEWPQFRGRNSGHSRDTGLPSQWAEDCNVAWKVMVPGRGWSSPVVADGKIWLTTALEDVRSLRLLGFAADSGELLHDIEVFQPQAWQPGHPNNSFASPTAAVEAGRVFVHFGTYGTAAIGARDGSVLWRRTELQQEHEVGPGSSPIVTGDLLIVHRDATDSQYLVARDKHTGEIRWQTARFMPEDRKPPHRKAFSTPLWLRHRGQPLLISTSAAHTSAYDPATGKEVWRVRHEGYSNVPMPVAGLGMVFINTGFMRPHLLAVRLGGEGDVTDSHVAWDYHWQVPANPSPLLIGSRLYMVNDQGNATWLDARTGEDLWRQRLRGKYYASPLYAHGRIYNWSIRGRSLVLEAGEKYRVLADNQIDGEIRATPAIADQAIFIRSHAHLYRIQELGCSAASEATNEATNEAMNTGTPVVE